jgi:hypothetical protein
MKRTTNGGGKKEVPVALFWSSSLAPAALGHRGRSACQRFCPRFCLHTRASTQSFSATQSFSLLKCKDGACTHPRRERVLHKTTWHSHVIAFQALCAGENTFYIKRFCLDTRPSLSHRLPCPPPCPPPPPPLSLTHPHLCLSAYPPPSQPTLPNLPLTTHSSCIRCTT